MGPLGELGALFNPGMRHEEEEKRSKEMLREEEGTGRKGRLGVDLESGVVVIGTSNPDRVSAEEDDATTEGAADPAGKRDDATAEGTADPAGKRDDATTEGTAPHQPRPGEARVAQRSATAVPTGKARRSAPDASTASPDGRSSDKPVGKARRQSRAR